MAVWNPVMALGTRPSSARERRARPRISVCLRQTPDLPKGRYSYFHCVDNIFCCLSTLTVVFFFYAQVKFLFMQLLILFLWYFGMLLPASVFCNHRQCIQLLV